jgi:hypothetical protein
MPAPKPAPVAAPAPAATTTAAPAAPPKAAAAPTAAPAPAPAPRSMPSISAKPPLMPPSAAPAPTAPAAAAIPALKPAPELDQLKFLLGRWRCEGKQFANPMFGPEHKFIATAESKVVVDGFWHQFLYEEKKSKEHHGLKVTGLWGWDQGAKHLVRVGTSNAGDWDTGSAPGLEGDKIVWTGEFSGAMGRTAYRNTFTKKNDKEWSHMLEIKDATGKFTATTDVACKR